MRSQCRPVTPASRAPSDTGVERVQPTRVGVQDCGAAVPTGPRYVFRGAPVRLTTLSSSPRWQYDTCLSFAYYNRLLVGHMLAKSPEDRPTLKDILARPFIRSCLERQLSLNAPPQQIIGQRVPRAPARPASQVAAPSPTTPLHTAAAARGAPHPSVSPSTPVRLLATTFFIW